MGTITINTPEGFEPYAADLEYFVSTMVRKLHTNRHKGYSHALVPKDMLKGAKEEMVEAAQALRLEGQFEFSVECVDVANFMFLASLAALHMTREEFKETVSDG